jgi:hypothetical protein
MFPFERTARIEFFRSLISRRAKVAGHNMTESEASNFVSGSRVPEMRRARSRGCKSAGAARFPK